MAALLGVTVVLASFASVATVGALAVVPWSQRLARNAAWRPRARAGLLLTAQAGPALLGLFVALGLVLPAFLRFEPSDATESPGWLLLAVAGYGALLMAGSGAAVGRALVETQRLRRTWLSGARQLQVSWTTPAFCIDAAFPIVAVVGVVRPLLFVARSVVESCSESELEAIIAHESAHLTSRDNIKRVVMRGASTVWAFLPGGRELVRAWTRAIEEAADERATSGCPERRLELASALARVARLATSPTPSADLPASALFTGPVETRIRRLLTAPASSTDGPGSRGPGRVVMFFGAMLTLVLLVLSLPSVHAGIEFFVRRLP